MNPFGPRPKWPGHMFGGSFPGSAPWTKDGFYNFFFDMMHQGTTIYEHDKFLFPFLFYVSLPNEAGSYALCPMLKPLAPPPEADEMDYPLLIDHVGDALERHSACGLVLITMMKSKRFSLGAFFQRDFPKLLFAEKGDLDKGWNKLFFYGEWMENAEEEKVSRFLTSMDVEKGHVLSASNRVDELGDEEQGILLN